VDYLSGLADLVEQDPLEEIVSSDLVCTSVLPYALMEYD
jgi:hypothetical protein